MTDVTNAIAPKSDQMNADDLMNPRTIKITDVKVQATPEQPIWVSFGGDNGRPWKPCKTAARCLAELWGTESKQWIGKSCTLYNDKTVTWGGMAVGGIRVSHAEGIDLPRELMMTKTRGKKGAVVIQPLRVASEPDAPPLPTPEQTQYAARIAARQGKSVFVAWWAANPMLRDMVKPIMADVQALTAAADAAMTAGVNDDEPPI